jgi:hypothetical protein
MHTRAAASRYLGTIEKRAALALPIDSLRCECIDEPLDASARCPWCGLRRTIDKAFKLYDDAIEARALAGVKGDTEAVKITATALTAARTALKVCLGWEKTEAV